MPFKLLVSINGIRHKTAWALLAYIGDIFYLKTQNRSVVMPNSIQVLFNLEPVLTVPACQRQGVLDDVNHCISQPWLPSDITH